MTGREADVTALAWLAGAFALGCGVGAAYFAGLWATVRALPAARRPALLVFGSFTVRFGSAATTFVLLARTGGWPWIVAALAGFVLARAVIIRRLLPPATMPAEDAI